MSSDNDNSSNESSSDSPPSDSTSPPSDTNSSPSPPSDQSSQQPPSPPQNSDNNNNNNDNSNGGDNSNNNNNNNDNNGNDNNNNGDNSKGNNNNNNNNNNSPNTPPAPPGGESKDSFRSLFLSPPKLDGHGHGGSSSHSRSSSSSHAPLIAGLVVGVGVLLLLLIIICIVCCCKRKKKKGPDPMQQQQQQQQYYRDVSQKGQQPQQSPQQPQQQYSGQYPPPPWQSQDMNYNNAPPSGMSMNQWGAPMMSAEMMTGGYSSGTTGPALPPPHPSMAMGFNKSSFTYDELAAATEGFAQSRLLGQGGFGYVHKGVLPNGKEVAVKSLKSGSGQGEREFQAEVEIISRVHHRHLVSLVGYCIAGGQRMLVYEFVPNDTLEFHLHGKGRPVMDFPTRMRIALGSAKGLAYLHEDCHPRIIHRDIKTANILIDLSFEAKVADFGLAKLSSDTNTHVSTRVMGTFGYLAPEYASSGKLTEKSDVFSFGIMLLELVTGRRPINPSDDEEDTLVDWARPLIARAMEERAVVNELVDPRLEGAFDHQEMLRLIACAGSAVKHSAKRRPKMSQIVRALEGDVSLDDLNDGTKSGGNSSAFSSSGGSSDYDTMSYNNDMKKFRKTAFSSTEYASSDYGTNEYPHV